jgi:hypothetical protein
MKNDLRVRCVQSLFLLAATILFMIALSVCGKIFFVVTVAAWRWF